MNKIFEKKSYFRKYRSCTLRNDFVVKYLCSITFSLLYNGYMFSNTASIYWAADSHLK